MMLAPAKQALANLLERGVTFIAWPDIHFSPVITCISSFTRPVQECKKTTFVFSTSFFRCCAFSLLKL